jgi:hypothetical protein
LTHKSQKLKLQEKTFSRESEVRTTLNVNNGCEKPILNKELTNEKASNVKIT